MASLARRMPSIIKKLDAAREALAELAEYENQSELHAAASRVKLQTDLREYADYLESATWWRKAT